MGTYYNFKVHMKGSKITTYVNGVPLPSLTVTDTSFLNGTYGPYSEVPYAFLKGFKAVLQQPDDTTAPWQAIVNQPITYSTTYSDPEHDPQDSSKTTWKFTNIAPQKFLDAGDGYSDPVGTNSYNGVIVQSPYPVITKVGVFKMDYQGADDPTPNGQSKAAFQSFAQYSDPATHNVIVHRPPVVQNNILVNSDGTFDWSTNDTSYDPDRWLSSTNYSTEATGINYQATRGILQHRYMYISPSGQVGSSKLIKPQETGTYTLMEAVGDEYGAWSDWYSQDINVTVLPLDLYPPAVTLTFPNGTEAAPSFVNTLTPTITWDQTDQDLNTTFTQYEVLIKDASGNTVREITGSQNTQSTSAEWTLDQSLNQGQSYQVQVQVWDDGGKTSGWSNIGWMITNRPPTATMTVPGGTEAAPTIFNSLRPTLQWSQTDPDPGTVFKAVQFQITNEANDVMILDSGQIAQNTSSTTGSWALPSDLPAGQKLRVWVRVYDGSTWSSYSPQTWFYMNRAPIANFDWSPKPVWEGDTATLINQSSDPDGDALTYSWKIIFPDHSMFSTTQKQFSRLFTMVGNYEVTLDVSDGIATSRLTQTIVAKPLTIQSDVTYTDQWLELHENSGDNTTQRPKDFYSGEIMVVQTLSSPAPVAEAKAWIDTTGLDGNRLFLTEVMHSTGGSTEFQGELFDPILQSMTAGLPIGGETIHFQIQYTNGTIKTEDIPIRIIGNANKSVGVHRVR